MFNGFYKPPPSSVHVGMTAFKALSVWMGADGRHLQRLVYLQQQDNWWEGRQCLSLRPVYNVKACGGKVGLSSILSCLKARISSF